MRRRDPIAAGWRRHGKNHLKRRRSDGVLEIWALECFHEIRSAAAAATVTRDVPRRRWTLGGKPWQL